MVPAKHMRKHAIGSLGKHEDQRIAPHQDGGCETVAHERKPKASVRAARRREITAADDRKTPQAKSQGMKNCLGVPNKYDSGVAVHEKVAKANRGAQQHV